MSFQVIMASPANYTKNRAAYGGSVKKITLHHMAGNNTVEQIGALWQNPARGGSSHYSINGRNVAQHVPEEDIAWTDGNWESNKNSITIEVANSGGAPDWPVSAESLEQTAQSCADIAKRNGLGKLVVGQNLTWHSMYAATECPGNFLRASMEAIANRANEINGYGSSAPTPKPQPQPAPSPAPAPQPSNGGWIAEQATYVPSSATYLRLQPNTNAGHIALIQPGTHIKYDAFRHDANGYTWIRQPRADGSYGYMATGNTKNGKRVDYWGKFF